MTFKALAPFVLLLGCGPKESTSTSAAAEATESAPSSANVPSDKASQAFSEKLFSLELSDFRPIDSDGAELKWSKATFSPDGTWSADGAVSIMDETMECKEGGEWTMDPAEDASTAGMTWALQETNCAGREVGQDLRVLLTIEKGGEYSVDFR